MRVASSATGWQQLPATLRSELRPAPGGGLQSVAAAFEAELPGAAPGARYKWIVDGEWRCDETAVKVADEAGNENNVLMR